MGKFGITELLIILAIVVLLFGTRKLKNMGGDIGGAIKNFKGALKDDSSSPEETKTTLEENEKTKSN
ncbi:MAG: Sec-independent protein translocase subunit TatA [Gammaproteobacteria bacterium]